MTNLNNKEKIKLALKELIDEALFNGWQEDSIAIEIHPDNYLDLPEDCSVLKVVQNSTYSKNSIKLLNLSNGNFSTYTWNI